ncbi:ribosomal protein L22/L17 [Gorgonomyces haynaldii]|nr:ribosomal protein L22/L17 [Gorgonomyces haynaldii]
MFVRFFKRYSTGVSPLFQAALKDAKPQEARQVILPTFQTSNMHVSPQKLNHLARMINDMSLTEAKRQMRFTPKRRGVNVYNLLSRVSHVLKHNYSKEPEHYFIKRAWVGKGKFEKRIRIHGRGRFGNVTRPRAHLKIQVEERLPETKEQVEFKKLVKAFKRHNLFVTMQDTKPLMPQQPIWSSKPYKYITSKKWMDPKNALKRQR